MPWHKHQKSFTSCLIVLLAVIIPQLSFAEKASSGLVRLAFTGDVLIHDGLYKQAVTQQSFDSFFTDINSYLHAADFTVVNLEGPTALGLDNQGQDHGDVGFTYDLKVYSGSNFIFNYHPSILKTLKKSGVDLVSLANNHSMDRGPKGIDRTLEMARLNDMNLVGIRQSFASPPRTIDQRWKEVVIKDIPFLFISCTESLNGFTDRHQQLLNCYNDSELIQNRIQFFKQQNQGFAVVMPHWGQEYNHRPNRLQVRHARLWSEAGADLIVGSHPHVLQPIDWIQNERSNSSPTLVAYSLGNFLAFQAGLSKKTGAILYTDFDKNGLKGCEVIATYRDGYKIHPAAGTKIPAARSEALARLGSTCSLR